jgi:hypothetical protein
MTGYVYLGKKKGPRAFGRGYSVSRGRGLCGVSSACLAVLLGILGGCRSVEGDWAAAQERNTVESYRACECLPGIGGHDGVGETVERKERRTLRDSAIDPVTETRAR